MKKFLLVCLLGLGLLMPSNNTTAKNLFSKRVITIYMEGYVLRASSDQSTGEITKVDIFNMLGQLVMSHQCGGVYICDTDVSGLKTGPYVALVTTTLTTYSQKFIR